jgi:hypothetical protein
MLSSNIHLFNAHLSLMVFMFFFRLIEKRTKKDQGKIPRPSGAAGFSKPVLPQG